MIALKIYAITTVISLIAVIVTEKAIKEKAKREGFKFIGKKSIWEEIRNALVFFVPVLNALMAIIMLVKYDGVYKESVSKNNNFIKTGNEVPYDQTRS